MTITSDQRKQLIDVYPYLQIKNIYTEASTSTNLVVGECLPVGWFRLFLMYCKAIKPYLNKHHIEKTFIFTDIKEKYGSLRLYSNFLPEEGVHIQTLYESFSKYVCPLCGNFATKQTQGYIMSLCDSCGEKDCFIDQETTKLPKKLRAVVTMYTRGTIKNVFFSLKHLKKQYEYILTMSDEAFIEYILTE